MFFEQHGNVLLEELDRMDQVDLGNSIYNSWLKRITEKSLILVPTLFKQGDGKDLTRAVDALLSSAQLLREKKLSKKLIHADLTEKQSEKDDIPLVDEKHLTADGKAEQQRDVQAFEALAPKVKTKEMTSRRALSRCSTSFFEEIKTLTLDSKREIIKRIAREWCFEPKCLL